MSRRRENCPNVNLTVIERARAIYHRNYDAYKRIVATNEKMADMLGVTERSVMSANAEPLKTSGWQVLILMAQIELEEERRKTRGGSSISRKRKSTFKVQETFSYL